MQSCIIRIHIDIIVSKNRYCHAATANDTAIVQTMDDMHCNAQMYGKYPIPSKSVYRIKNVYDF